MYNYLIQIIGKDLINAEKDHSLSLKGKKIIHKINYKDKLTTDAQLLAKEINMKELIKLKK